MEGSRAIPPFETLAGGPTVAKLGSRRDQTSWSSGRAKCDCNGDRNLKPARRALARILPALTLHVSE